VEHLISAALVYEQLGNRDAAVMWTGKALELGYPWSDIEQIPELRPVLADKRLDSKEYESEHATPDSVSKNEGVE
jgi:hypothetical protein